MVPTLVPKHNSRFESSTAQSVDHDDRLTFMKYLVQEKFADSMWNLVSAPCSETGLTLRTFFIVGFSSPNFAQR